MCNSVNEIESKESVCVSLCVIILVKECEFVHVGESKRRNKRERVELKEAE